MADAKVGSKKKGTQRVRMLDGKVVRPCLYNGRALGHGLYYAGYVEQADKKGSWPSDLFVYDENGKPRPYNEIGELVLE